MLKSLKWALAELMGHHKEIAAISAQIAQRDQFIAELEAKAKHAERAAHWFSEGARYSLETAAQAIEKDAPARSKELATIAYALPYIFSGRSNWEDRPRIEAADDARAMALKVARQYGIELPDDPVYAVRCLLRLSITVLKPELSLPVEHMRGAWPAKEA